MKRFLLALLLLAGLSTSVSAADGYRIQVKLTDVKDSIAYLAYYYGKPMPTIYKIDSARFDKSGVATFKSKDTLLGGIYIVILSDMQTYFEVLLNNGDDMSITAPAYNLPLGLKFKNSPENERFINYLTMLGEYGNQQEGYTKALAAAKTKTDSSTVYSKSAADGKKVTAYRQDYIKQYPNTLLANIFGALESPTIPAGPHYLKDGKTIDTTFGYFYLKNHFWDGFDFRDDRLIHSPIYDAKLQDYFKRMVVNVPDSINKEADILLAKTRGTKDLFKYTLHWITQYIQNSDVMGMDEALVYIIENYHMKGDATWLSPEQLTKFIERARSIAPNVIGNVGPDIVMQGLDKKQYRLSEMKSKYTLLVFWSPTCGTCNTEVPKLDSVYRAVLKDKGVKVFAVRTDSDVDIWEKKIKEHGITGWTNVYDPEHKSNYKAQYDVYATPSMYLLDDKMIIRGKRLDHNNVVKLIEILEMQNKSKTN